VAELVLYFLFGSLAIVGALAVVLARNPVKSAMGLILTMVSLAVLYVVHLAHFVAAVQVIVYAGAVMTLFLFVIMLIGVDREEDLTEHLPGQKVLVILLGVVSLGAIVAVLAAGGWTWVTGVAKLDPPPNGTAEAIGSSLLTDWVLPFEATALLLIVASVGAIALALFRPGKGEVE
jgi:NADH-quinone oxidoreductase subunit J